MDSAAIHAAIVRIEALAQSGLLEPAEALSRELVAIAPREHKAWAWLGMLGVARGQAAEAEKALQQALALEPRDSRYWNTLSLALRMQARPAEAEAAARNALALQDASDYWSELGNTLYDQQRWPDAAEAYQQALARNPHDASNWTSLGAAEHAMGRFDAAQAAYERSLLLVPAEPGATTRLALVLVQRGQIDRGIEMVREVLARFPQLMPAWLVLGNAERLRDRLESAEAAYRRAIELAPADRDARYNLALVLLQRLAFAESEAWARQIVAQNPRDAETLTVLGGALHAQARMDEAIRAMSRSVELAPNPTTHSKLLVAMHYAEAFTPAELLQAHRHWDAAYARPLAAAMPPAPAGGLSSDLLRMGFIGLDFSIGPTGFLALRAVESLDKARCSVVCYCDRASHDAYTARFHAAADAWRDSLGLSDEELAAQVRRDNIDVLIDLGGHVGRRLLAFARRPAQLQVTWLGYVGTTGMAAMDGLLADRFHVREGEEAWYTEKVLRLPDGYACYGPPANAPDVAQLPALQTGQLTFGCFNNGAKYSPQSLDAWAAVLRRLPQSKLLLKYGGLDQPSVQSRIRGQLAERGIAGERIVMEGWSEHRDLLACYNRVDLALDTQPYSGGLTTCEAMWMGVPVITWPGLTFAGRHSTSHLTNAGLGQFVAADMAGYVELAAHWAGRIDELAAIRAAMREQMTRSPLCNGPRFARNLLALLRHAWEEQVQETS